ncbi:hypothetical protein AX16_001339 [Volvariella volvacea WC 439]|nr:hypothetical protein AX16_001339 [Volvariella volvacea WC 439]
MSSPQQIVEDAIANNTVAIFSKSYCPYCKATKKLFAEEFPDLTPNIIELDLRADGDAIQQYLLQKSGQRTVPNVYVNKQHVGGNDATQASFKAGKLAVLISSTA